MDRDTKFAGHRRPGAVGCHGRSRLRFARIENWVVRRPLGAARQCRRARVVGRGTMSEAAVKQIVLASRPKGLPTHENFRLQDVPMPELPPGGLLLRVLYLSLDPYMRGRMDDRKSYAKPVGLGEGMTGESVCEAIASDQTGYAVGAIVLAHPACRT